MRQTLSTDIEPVSQLLQWLAASIIDSEENLTRHQGIAQRCTLQLVARNLQLAAFIHVSPETRRFTGPDQ
ncbi:hypothetical protein [Roseiconus lacunae]|uniref:hypothetical protein n=1 Tax=Roseiconus lacunae TaxID=2605694 RepID=UPI001E390382|nr:hypothetical protein [Roseiconus lacunae]